MDKRVVAIKELYSSHCRLVEVFHKQPISNNSLLEFCELFVGFAKTLSLTNVTKRFDYIFTPVPKLDDKDVVKAHLLTASEYAQTLIDRINENPLLDLRNELIGVVFDYAKLLKHVEKVYNIPFGNFIGSRNMRVDSYTSYKIAKVIFWAPKKVQRSNTLNGYAIFALRQAIELAGKELLGLEHILEANGKIFLYDTQIPWDFIATHRNATYFSLPFDPLEIRKIYQWSNHFVHTGHNALCYATALALLTVEKLYQKKSIIDFRGQHFQSANEIYDYNRLKDEFQLFLSSRFTKNEKNAKWAHAPTLAVVVRKKS